MQTLSEDYEAALIMAMVGAPENYQEQHRLQRLTSTGSNCAAAEIVRSSTKFLTWRKDGPSPPTMPSDWQMLVEASSGCMAAVGLPRPAPLRQSSFRVFRLVYPGHGSYIPLMASPWTDKI